MISSDNYLDTHRAPSHQIELLEEPLSLRLLAGLHPVLRRQLEDARPAPDREQREDVAQVGPRLEAVHLAARDQRHDGGVPLGGAVAADEEPVLAPDDLAAQLELGGVRVQTQFAVVQEPGQRASLPQQIPDRRLQRVARVAAARVWLPC